MQPHAQPLSKFRNDIQALRGLAVFVVLLHHLNVPGFQFGYLGVDIFFVVSGYAISSLIFKQCHSNSWSLKQYYIRRVWRLLPALYTVLLCVFVMAILSPPSYRIPILESIPFAATGTSNLYFYTNTGYFDNESVLKPLLHTWSLSVEEQFYLLFTPVIAYSIFRNSTLSYLTGAFIVVGVVALLLGANFNSWFYLLPSRALELLTGAGAFFLYQRQVKIGCGSLANLINTLVILAAIPVFSVVRPDAMSAAVLITITTAVFLLNPGSSSELVFHRNTPLIGLGAISYSLYLVHWPIISFATINNMYVDTAVTKVVILVISLAAGYILYLHVERRFYFKRKGRQLYPLPYIVLCGLALFAMPIVSVLVLKHNEEQISPVVAYRSYFKENYKIRYEYGMYGSCFLDALHQSNFNTKKCLTLSKLKPNLLLIGDSHAAYFGAGLRAKFTDFNIMQSTEVSCPPLLKANRNESCLQRNEAHFSFAAANDIEMIVLFANWEKYDNDSLMETLDFLTTEGRQVVLVWGSPNYRKQLARILFDAATVEEAQVFADHLSPYAEYGESVEKIKAFATSIGVSFISIPDLLCKEDSCEIIDEYLRPLFFDYGHMTEEGANCIAERLRNMLEGKAPLIQVDTIIEP